MKALKDSPSMRNKMLRSDETKIELFGLYSHLPNTIPRVKLGGGNIRLGETGQG